MATRRLALIGAEVGPWVYTAQVFRPRLRISGLRNAVITLEFPDGVEPPANIRFVEDGVHELEVAPWVRVRCTPRCPSVVCEILSRGALGAVHNA